MLYSAVWLVTLNFGTKFKVLAKNKMASLSLAYFVWVVIGGVYSSYPGEAEKDIILKIPFAAWAILMGSVLLFHERHRALSPFGKQAIFWQKMGVHTFTVHLFNRFGVPFGTDAVHHICDH